MMLIIHFPIQVAGLIMIPRASIMALIPVHLQRQLETHLNRQVAFRGLILDSVRRPRQKKKKKDFNRNNLVMYLKKCSEMKVWLEMKISQLVDSGV
ncbi:hypothetical protein HI914_01888 [Erysiphe necator]|nr:hypothetical protein HI914_01888 [Erysiphe necator]